MKSISWMDNANCRNLASDDFFPTPGDREREYAARQVCEGCEVSRECHEFAKKSNNGRREDFGIWAGVQHEKAKRAHVATLKLRRTA